MKAEDPAYPCSWMDVQPDSGQWVPREQFAGLSIRAYLAAKAMQGILQLESGYGSDKRHHEFVAEYAVKYADALIQALNEKGGTA